METFKPNGYNSLSPYFVVRDAQRFVDLIKAIFSVSELRRYDLQDGTIMHMELMIDDTVIMLGESSEEFPPTQLLVHVYVPDVDETFRKAIDIGCHPIEVPKERDGDPDRRGTFRDFSGNIWSVGTQKEN
ncbi:VOC family protein [Paenibacillus tarimensis]